MIPEIDAATLRAELDGPNPPVVLDVREADELEVSRLPDGIRHIPLGKLPTALTSLDPESKIVVVCRVGGRSAQAVQFLRGNGFKDVRNLAGGMNGYAREVDPTLTVY